LSCRLDEIDLTRTVKGMAWSRSRHLTCRAQIHGDGDDAVRWQGTFVSYGGHAADQSTTIVFEIEPGERLGWHTDQTEETQYIVTGTGELHRDDGVFLVGRSASSPPRCSRRSSTM
jgi:quercetin dioxygenase-like cupin family protein